MGIPKQHGESRTYRFSSRPKCPKVYRFLYFRQMTSTYSEAHFTRVRSHTLPRRFRSLLQATENAGLGAGQQCSTLTDVTSSALCTRSIPEGPSAAWLRHSSDSSFQRRADPTSPCGTRRASLTKPLACIRQSL